MKRSILAAFLVMAACGCVTPMGDEMTRASKNNPAEMAPVSLDGNTLLAVAPIIARNGWWTGNNELGYELEFQDNVQNRQTILKLSEWGPPVTWTVTLGIEHDLIATLDNRLDVKAVIEFGAGGATQEVMIDWREGNAISLPGNSFNIIAEYGDIDTPPSNTRLRVTMARGSLLNPRPTLTQAFQFFPAPGFAQPLPAIPKFAQSLLVVPDDRSGIAQFISAATPAIVELFGTSDGLVPAGAFQGNQMADFPLGFPITGNARYWNAEAPLPVFDAEAVFFIGL